MNVRLLPVATGLLAFLIASGAFAVAAPMNSTDQTFATEAVQGGMAEVADAQLALGKSHDPMVVTFARRMVHDHSAANAQLAAILRHEGIAVPDSVGPANLMGHAKLELLQGEAFNSAYLKAQRTAHEQTISLFRQEIAMGHNRALAGFARATLPTVMAHLQMLNRRSSM